MAGPGDGLSMAEGRASMDEVPFSVPGAAVSCRGKTALVQQWWVSPKALPPPPPPFRLSLLIGPDFSTCNPLCCGLRIYFCCWWWTECKMCWVLQHQVPISCINLEKQSETRLNNAQFLETNSR